MLKTFGEDLKRFRESKKITLLQITNETKIHITNLERMEKGDFSFMPPPYVRAFLKQYIKSVGLDESDTLYKYDLAKSGKYESSGQLKGKHTEDIIEEPIKKEEPLKKEEPKPLEEKTEEKKEQEIKPAKEVPTLENLFEEKIPAVPVKTVKAKEKRRFVRPSPVKKIEVEKNVAFGDEPEARRQPPKKSISISPSIFKSLGIIAVVLLMGYGIYLLVTTVFITGSSKTKYDIVRQNFDTVVKENEKKILGKRSKEEIEDSIKSVQHTQDSIKRVMNDSISLEIKCLKKGYISVITDSISYQNMDKESFDKDYTGSWKAKKFFWITSNNTTAFELYLNGKKLDIKDTKVKYLKIGKEGIVKSNDNK